MRDRKTSNDVTRSHDLHLFMGQHLITKTPEVTTGDVIFLFCVPILFCPFTLILAIVILGLSIGCCCCCFE